MTAQQHGAGHERHDHAPSTRRRVATAAALGVAACTAAGGAVLAAAPAGAATAPNHGSVSYAWQDRSTHTLHIRGYAYKAHSNRSTNVAVYVDGKRVHTSAAKNASPVYDRHHHLKGKHGFRSSFRAPSGSHTVTLKAGGRKLTSRHITQYRSTGAYLVFVARKHVGATYRYGADGPRAFDCSGYAKYVFGKTDVATLPHNAESQRHARHMHGVSKKSARPGDLVFYLSGGDAYHVAIYAGHGKQYSATNPSRGVEYSKISSRHVVFKTDWH
ncbi:C40 family peptidase [uncultured Jatrophihabitans sp.]|uniref:C40 family peptidase n=1 Tax=uncultured Jatrophihabitans sp. TaxID=1610747 RepID=UPI0035CB90A6